MVGEFFVFVFFFNEKTVMVRTRNSGVQLSNKNQKLHAHRWCKKKKNKKKIVRGSEASNKIKAKARNIQSYSC